MGHYCPNGTAHPLGCPPGSYAATSGLDACIACPAGYFCPLNSTDYAATTALLDTTVLQALSTPPSILVLLAATTMPQVGGLVGPYVFLYSYLLSRPITSSGVFFVYFRCALMWIDV